VVIKIISENLVEIALLLKGHSLCCYYQLIEIATEDTPQHQNRFRINYIFSSLLYGQKIIISLTTNELHYLPSLTQIFFSAG